VSARKPPGKAVPVSPLSRLARYGALGAGLARDALDARAQALATGGSTQWSDLVFTPAAAKRFTDELSRLRGAALKAGQLISMDAGAMLPREFADAAERLRASAEPMAPRQLRRVLDERWGPGWLRRFERFEVRPVAAASIGQVHKAVTRDGRTLAVKILYPGVRQSIDSDIDAVGAFLAMSGLVPKGMDLAPLLAEAKRQLHRETDYELEADNLRAYARAIAHDPRFVTPGLDDSLSGPGVLAMDWLDGRAIETAANEPSHVRAQVFDALLDLTLDELFAHGLMQTDPNFANFLYAGPDAPIGLIDFGAVQAISPDISARYRAVLAASLGGERGDLRRALEGLGVISSSTRPDQADALVSLTQRSMAPVRAGAAFDFSDSALVVDMRTGAEALRKAGFNHAPPAELIFIQRKLGGLYLLGARLGIRKDLRPALLKRLS
jgi:predicted unusual protein kinase regulating ubiquinone biosynthesis (AarF/ABC1/UbiB family)